MNNKVLKKEYKEIMDAINSDFKEIEELEQSLNDNMQRYNRLK